MALSTSYQNLLGDLKESASEVASAYNERRNLVGTAATGDYFNRTLCAAPHNISAGQLTGPQGMRYNVECNKLYPRQASIFRRFQVESSHIGWLQPRSLVPMPGGNVSLDNAAPSRRPTHHTTRADNTAMAREMLSRFPY